MYTACAYACAPRSPPSLQCHSSSALLWTLWYGRVRFVEVFARVCLDLRTALTVSPQVCVFDLAGYSTLSLALSHTASHQVSRSQGLSGMQVGGSRRRRPNAGGGKRSNNDVHCLSQSSCGFFPPLLEILVFVCSASSLFTFCDPTGVRGTRSITYYVVLVECLR